MRIRNLFISIPTINQSPNYQYDITKPSNKKKLWIEAPVNKSNERLDFRNRKSSDEIEKEQKFDFVGEIEIFINLANPVQIIKLINENQSEINLLPQSKIHLIFDLFNENNMVEEAFTFSLLLLKLTSAGISKYTLKSFYFICGKTKRYDFGEKLVNYIEMNHSELTEKNSSDLLLYVSKQYYIFCLQKSEKRTSALEEFYRLCEVGKENKKIEKYVLKSSEFLIKEFVKSKEISLAKQIVQNFKGLNFEFSEIYFNKLIDYCSKNDCLELCELILITMNEIKILPSLVTYNTILDSYIRSNLIDQAWALFNQLKKTPTTPDRFTYTTMINCVKKSEFIDLEKAFELLEDYKKVAPPDRVIYNCLLDVCVSANNFQRAEEVLEEMKTMGAIFRLDDISFNILIKASCRAKNLKKAVAFFEDMKSQGISPTIITYNSLLDTFVKAGNMEIVWKFYDAMIQDNIKADPYTYSILINGIKSSTSKGDDLNKINSLYKNLISQPEFRTDQVIYNSIIDAFIGFQDFNRALEVFNDMKKAGVKPSTITFNILIKGYGLSNQLEMAFAIFNEMEKYGIKKNDITFGCLIEACVRNKEIQRAYEILEQMKILGHSENSIQITSIIKGLSRMGKNEEAIELANVMMNETFENKKKLNLISYNCLIDVYIRGGEFKLALKLFKLLQKEHKPDLITYSTLIKGSLKQKDYKLSSELFNEMLSKSIKPDDVIFNMILDFCVINKLHEQGLKLFESLLAHNLKPSERTFGLMLKIYGQTRRYEDAYEILTLMAKQNVKPSLITYTSLLQICINEKRGEKIDPIFNRILEDNIKLDSICFNKLVCGSIRCNKIDLAIKYYMYSRELKIEIDSETKNKFTDALKFSTNPNKSRVQILLNTPTAPTMNKSNGYVPRFEVSSDKENRNMNIQNTERITTMKDGIRKREVREFKPY